MKKQPMPMMKGMDMNMPPAMKKTMGKKKAAPKTPAKAPAMKKGGKVCGMKKGGKVC